MRPGKQGGLHIAAAPRPVGLCTASGNRRPIGAANVEIGQNLFLMNRVDQRTYFGFRVKRVADFDCLGAGGDGCGEAAEASGTSVRVHLVSAHATMHMRTLRR